MDITSTSVSEVVSDDRATFDSMGRVLDTTRLDPHDGDGQVLLARVIAYDNRGRPVETEDPFGHRSLTSYVDTPQGLTVSVTSTTADPDGLGPLSGFTTTTNLDPLTGLVKSTVDTNGRVTEATSDALGRLRTVRYPQHEALELPSVEYEYLVSPTGLNSVIVKTLGADGETQHISSTLYDGLLRPFQTQTEGVDAGADHDWDAAARGRLIAHTYYNSAGRVEKETGQWPAEGVPSSTPVVPIAVPPSLATFEYDGAGRTTAESFWVGTDSQPSNARWRTVTAYDGAIVLTIPPMGATPTAVTLDALGNTIERREFIRDADLDATADTPSEVLALDAQTTSYTFDAAGRLIAVHDPVGNAWTYEYDWAGRQTLAVDPDAGTTATTYDLVDRVLTRTNGNGDTLAYTYDALGRTTSLRDGSQSGTIRAEWTYDESVDTLGATVLGVLTSATRYIDGDAYTTTTNVYDDAYQPLSVTTSLPSNTTFTDALESTEFTTEYRYTFDGQGAAVTLPAITSATGITALGVETVTTRFDTASVPEWVGGGFGWGTYVAESRVAADGRLVAADLGNTYGAVVSYSYEDGTKRLNNISLTRQTYGVGLSLDYRYDPAGNITHIHDQASPDPSGQDNQCFGYDGLARIEVAWTSLTGDCSVAQSELVAADIGGVSPYWTEYEYDAIGNRTQLIEHALAAGSGIITNYSHGGPGLGAHQLSQLTELIDGVPTTTSFGYDAAGNRTSATTGSEATNYQWDVESELIGVDDAEYLYDATGSRIVRTDELGTTVYLPGGQELLISSEGAVSATRYYSFAGQTVAVRESSGLRGVDSLVTDHQGSIVAAVPNTEWTAETLQVVRTDPYGAVRDETDTGVPGDKRFLGLTHDSSSGLSLFGARYYDANTGTFISVDPLLDLANPAQFNAYVYSWNNPVTFSDPSGELAAKHDGGGGSSSNGTKSKTPTTTAPPKPADPFRQAIRNLVQGAVNISGLTSVTQNPGFLSESAFWHFGWERDETGDYHARREAWQSIAGYNKWFDEAFHLGTDMETEKYEFQHEGNSYAFWAWKGDYLNLGAGAELGLYTQEGPLSQAGDFWGADPDNAAVQMSMTLSYRGAEIGSYDPSEDQWWLTTWDPDVQNPAAGDITADFTVDFSKDPGMFDSFHKFELTKGSNSDWVFNTETKIATLRFRRKKGRDQ